MPELDSKDKGSPEQVRVSELAIKSGEIADLLPAFLGIKGPGGMVEILYAAMMICRDYKRELEAALGQGATISVSSGDAGASARAIVGGRIVYDLIERETISDPLVKEAFEQVLSGSYPAFSPEEFCRAFSAMLDEATEDEVRMAIGLLCNSRGREWKSLLNRGGRKGAVCPDALALCASIAPDSCGEVAILGSGGLEACPALELPALSSASVSVARNSVRPGLALPMLMALKALGRDSRAFAIESPEAIAPSSLVICHPALEDLEGGFPIDNLSAKILSRFEPPSSAGSSRHRTDNFWVVKALDLIRNGGTAVVFLPSSFTSLARFGRMRDHLLRNSLLKAVVSLPSGLYHGSWLPLSMLVLKGGSDVVRLIDASCVKAGAGGALDDEAVKAISGLLLDVPDPSFASRQAKSGMVFGDALGDELLLQGKALIDPAKVIFNKREKSSCSPAVRLGDLATILRGPLVKPGELSELMMTAWASEAVPGAQMPASYFINLSELESGFLYSVQDGLSSVRPEWLKNLVRDGDLLLSRNASPIRMAIACLGDDDKGAVLSSNVYALRFKDKDDALLVYSYFSSRKGVEALKAASTGTLIRILSVKQLKDLRIPAVSTGQKKEICKRCLKAIKDMEKARQGLEKAKCDLEESFDPDEGSPD